MHTRKCSCWLRVMPAIPTLASKSKFLPIYKRGPMKPIQPSGKAVRKRLPKRDDQSDHPQDCESAIWV